MPWHLLKKKKAFELLAIFCSHEHHLLPYTAFQLVYLYPSVNSKFLDTRIFLTDYLPAANNFWIYSYFNQNSTIHHTYLVLQKYKPTWIFWKNGQWNKQRKIALEVPLSKRQIKQHLSVLLTANHKRNIQPLSLPIVLSCHCMSSATAYLQPCSRGTAEQVLGGKPATDKWKKTKRKRREETEDVAGICGIW